MEQAKIRKPSVAGQFYPSSCQGIKNQIESFIDKRAERTDVIACMLPHAGYMYSGSVASQTVSRINIKDTIILLGPNHTGMGPPFSIMTQGVWQTPLGEIKIDSDLADALVKNSKHLESDSLAHAFEHSLEVELPIFQYFKSDFKIVPITILSDDLEILKQTGQEIAGVIKESKIKDSCLIVASSDMTHYEPQAEAAAKDKQAIDAILALNEDKLMEKIMRFGISMCGYAAVIVMLKTAKTLGAKSASLIKYQTSGDVTGDLDSVVGYAGITIY
jgi:AmmeMemoRadiSam system protein B